MLKSIVALTAFLFLAACGQNEPTQTQNEPGDAATSEMAGEIVATGEFSGLSDHVTTGDVTIRKDGASYIVVLEANFSLDGAPDPTLGFGNGDFIAETQFSALNSKTGKQVYTLPAGLDPADFSQIYVWCEQFSVPLGVATLN